MSGIEKDAWPQHDKKNGSLTAVAWRQMSGEELCCQLYCWQIAASVDGHCSGSTG
jgi:hypothetical protein